MTVEETREKISAHRTESGLPSAAMRDSYLAIGMDVGSTTVKAAVVDPTTKAILWNDYQRHHTKQPEKVKELLEAILAAFPDKTVEDFRIFLTGSGAAPL